jgi:hypothetical protein
MTRTLGQVIVDGEPYREVDTLDNVYGTPASWLVAPEGGALMVHFAGPDGAPPGHLVEISVRGRIFAPHTRGLGYIHVRGFVFEHCANQWPMLFWDSKGWPQMGAVSTRSGHHWVIENNTIRYAKTVGIDCGSEGPRDLEGDQPMPPGAGHHLISGNRVTDNGLVGIFGWTHTATRVTGNTIERNNALGFKDGEWESGGIKFHGFTDGLIEGNLIRHNDAYGIWLDNGWTRARVTRNAIVDNLWAGIFVELGAGPVTIDNNVIGYTRSGDGIYAHDSSAVTVTHNLLFANAGFGVWMHVTPGRRLGGQLTAASHERILNNLVLGNHVGAIGLPLDGARGKDNFSDGNLFGPGSSSGSRLSASALFAIHNNAGSVTREEMAKAYGAIFESLPGLENWLVRPFAGFEQWRKYTGRDAGSRVMEKQPGYIERSMLRSALLEVDLGMDSQLEEVLCMPVDGVERDYAGAPIPRQKPLPGPFQHLKRGLNRIPLWPVEGLRAGAGQKE